MATSHTDDHGSPLFYICEPPYKTVRVLSTFGLRFIVLSYRTHQYEHFEEKKYARSHFIYRDMRY